jgi:hypothetical protein
MNNWWIGEVFAGLVSLGSLVAIFVIYYEYNNKSLDSWPYPWSINSVIGFVSTIIHLALLFQLGAAIGQLKWLWFKERHTLLDIDNFDQASRGPVGSVAFLHQLKFK